jgi:hypothetical protein
MGWMRAAAVDGVRLDVRVNDCVFVGEDERRWTLVEARLDARSVRLAGPDGDLHELTAAAEVEIEPGVRVRLGAAGGRRWQLVFRAPAHVPVNTAAMRDWVEARRGDL